MLVFSNDRLNPRIFFPKNLDFWSKFWYFQITVSLFKLITYLFLPFNFIILTVLTSETVKYNIKVVKIYMMYTGSTITWINNAIVLFWRDANIIPYVPYHLYSWPTYYLRCNCIKKVMENNRVERSNTLPDPKCLNKDGTKKSIMIKIVD